MTTTDWILNAARELANNFGFRANHDSYVTNEQRANVAKNYAAIIQRHSPFQDGVAYMPVPRCDGCKHWEQYELENVGICLEARKSILCSTGGNTDFETKEDFGCVRWEKK